ncbi:hypothetical protein CY35_05G138500 [Sphagnum magellanicum]|jgi:hypothetical protein|nr:hypothetical protein CY35_05G138500 [Sphagnum magellanicum]KAH9563678.1 hypothetical protein CY35_05G138500 [Sphagnum magellanicum]
MSLDTCTAAAEGGGTSTSSSLLLYDCHKSVPAPFLTKTYHLVNDPATDYIVSWKDSDTSSFVVWRPPEFARDLLPIYFKHSNFSSFVRQLNTYGFKKLVPYRWEFGNDFFRRGQIHLLSRIHRRKSVPPAPASSGKSIPAAAPHHRRTVNSASNPPRAAQLQQQNHSWSVLSTTTTTPLSSSSPRPAIILDPPAVHDHNVVVGHGRAFISDETEKLRKDNTLLHSENSRLRRLLYDYKQQLAAAASPQQQQACLSRIKGVCGNFGISLSNVEGLATKLRDSSAAGVVQQRVDRVDSAANVAGPKQHLVSTLSFLNELFLQDSTTTSNNSAAACPKVITISRDHVGADHNQVDHNTTCKNPPKLFGVPLHTGHKRLDPTHHHHHAAPAVSIREYPEEQQQLVMSCNRFRSDISADQYSFN